jgi:hypothetical protein
MPFQSHGDPPGGDPRIAQAERKAAFIPHLLEGNQAMADREYAAAIELYKKAIQMHPEFHLGYARIGDAYYKMECYAEATAVYKRALELNPAQVDVLYRLAKCYKARNMDIQAEAAFDTARAMDTQGAYTERIQENVASLKDRDARAGRGAGLFSTLGRTLVLMATRPRLLLPFALLYALTVTLTVALNFILLGGPAAHAPKFSLENQTSFLYYFILGAATFLINVPFVASAMVTVRDLYDGKEDSFTDTLKYSYTRLPSMIGVTLLSVFLLGGAGLGALVAVALLALPYTPPAARVYLDFAPLAAMAIFAPLFSYSYQFILIDRKNFDDSISASFRLGIRRYIRTALLLCVCGLPLLALIRYSLSWHFAGQIVLGLLRVPLLCFGVVALTVFFQEATGRKYQGKGQPDASAQKHRRHNSKHRDFEQHPDGIEDTDVSIEDFIVPELPAPPAPSHHTPAAPDIAEHAIPDPDIPEDLILEEHVEMPDHLRHIDLSHPLDPEDSEPGV